MQTKEWGLQANRPVAVKQRSLSHSLVLSLAPFCLLATSETGGGEKAENRFPPVPLLLLSGLNREGNDSVPETFINLEFILPGLLFSSEMASFVFNDVPVQVRQKRFSQMRSTANYYKIYTVSQKQIYTATSVLRKII